MSTFFRPRILHIFAAVGLAVLSGCKGGIGGSMPDVSMPSIFARGNERKAPASEPKLPAPDVTERNFAQVQMAMGDSLAKEGNFEAAQSAYEAALRNDDTLARAYHRLALMNEKTGKGSDAKDLLQQAMKLDPKNAEIVCDYGYCCYLRQDWQESQKHFERALQLDPNMKRAHNNLGLIYARTDRANEALQQFASAGLSPADARANLGFVYLTEKRFSEAKAELQMAATANPGSAKARDILARFEKIETSAQPQQAHAATESEQVQTISASAPVAEPPVRAKFNMDSQPAPLPSETARVARAEESIVTAPQTPRVPMIGNSLEESSPERPTSSKLDLPTQQLAPALSDYHF